MSVVAVLGAGAGGLSCAAELSLAGHQVRVWNRGAAALPADGEISYTGVLGEGSVTAAAVSTDLAATVAGADAVVVSLPALGHGAVFAGLAAAGCAAPVVLNPGHTGGALHLRQVFAARGVPLPPVAELSTLTYVARRATGDGGAAGVRITGRAGQVRCAALPGGAEAAACATALFPGTVSPAPDVLATSLSNVNLVLHPPGAILSAAWVEATGGVFTFYVDAMTDGVGRVIDALDAERRAVAASFGHKLPSLAEEMAAVGTVPASLTAVGSTAAAVRAGEANKTLRAPDSLRHRYYQEDFPYAVTPFLALAAVAGIATPVASALLTVARALTGGLDGGLDEGLDAAGLGIDGLTVDGLLRLVRA
jgi:opine dehydrogenase